MMWEHYLAGFTEVDENSDSTKIFFAISLEALDRHNHAKPVRILQRDLKTLLTFGDEFFDEVSSLFLPMVLQHLLQEAKQRIAPILAEPNDPRGDVGGIIDVNRGEILSKFRLNVSSLLVSGPGISTMLEISQDSSPISRNSELCRLDIVG